MPWAIEDVFIQQFQPNIPNGGRANTVAVHPTLDDIILVASESGGLFRSTTGGSNWHHIDTLPAFYTNAVAFVRSDPTIVIATTSEDFGKSSHGGIWRSADGGDTWAPVLWRNPATGKLDLPPSPAPPSVTNRFSGYEISLAPDTGLIYIASTDGLEIGDPDGESWEHHDLSVASPQVVSVLALPEKTQGGGNVLLAGGPTGIFLSTDGGKTWSSPKTTPGCDSPGGNYPTGCIVDMHAFGRSPVATDQAYVVNGDKQLFYTEDGGDTWVQIQSTPAGGGGCGGIAFIQVVPSTQTGSIDLYFGNRCSVSKLTAPPVPGTNRFTYTGVWNALQSDHGDTRHIAFSGKNEPIMLATDGGLHKTPDRGLTWKFAGGGKSGYNALQLYEVDGQWIDDVGVHNLYFGTQDNYLWSSGDGGETWSHCCTEGGFFEAEYRVATARDSQITFYTGENERVSKLLLSDGVTPWLNPPGQDDSKAGRPTIVRKDFHVQGVDAANVPGGSFSKGLAVTYSFAQPGTWQQYAAIPEDRRDLPRLSRGPIKGGPVLYQAIRTGFDPATALETHGLARVVKHLGAPDASVSYPRMNNFGGFGIAPTMDAWIHVFAVDPADVNHLIAADVISEEMMETWDGGDNWTAMKQLTSLVTADGQLNFRGRVFFSQFPPMWYTNLSPITQASAISFCPDNPKTVAVGTVQNGVFISRDRGQTWIKVPESERATLITSLHWRKTDDMIVATYGRGLWRVGFQYIVPIVEFACRAPDCFHIYYERPPKQRPTPYDHVLLAFEGHVEGVRIMDGILREVFVRPGTTIAFALDSPQLADIRVTETTSRAQFLGVTNMPNAPKGAPIMTGVTLRKTEVGSALVGFLFSPKPRSMYVPDEKAPAETRPVGREQSPTHGKPYLEGLGGPVANPGSTIQLTARALPPNSKIEIAIDGYTIQSVASDQTGGLAAAALPTPHEFGFHSLTIASAGRVIDGALVGVRPDS